MQQFYYWYFFSTFSFRKRTDRAEHLLPVSVIICAKNEAEHLKNNLPKFLNQTVKTYEIVLVDDHSDDETAAIMRQFAREHEIARVVTKEQVKNKPGKKHALYAGVKHAEYNYIVVTDADCFPATSEWLSHMVAPLAQQAELVLGLSPNTKSFSFWKNFFRFETYLTALQYVSYANRYLPYMGVGRNMAYTKDFFQQHFVQVLDTDFASGDDDLLVNFGANASTTAVVTNEMSFTLSDSPDSLSSWFRQKTRHLSAGFTYKPIHQFLLSLFSLSFLVFFFCAIWLLFTPLIAFAIIGILGYFFTISLIHGFGLQHFKAADLVFEAPLYLLFWHFFLPFISVTSLFKKHTTWNK